MLLCLPLWARKREVTLSLVSLLYGSYPSLLCVRKRRVQLLITKAYSLHPEPRSNVKTNKEKGSWVHSNSLYNPHAAPMYKTRTNRKYHLTTICLLNASFPSLVLLWPHSHNSLIWPYSHRSSKPFFTLDLCFLIFSWVFSTSILSYNKFCLSSF